ncbi:MAG: hypothetical protein ACRD3J_16015 [Thermoanaerobaculia bacterium]
MTALTRWSVIAVASLLILLNLAHISLGFVRLKNALLAEPIPERFADPLKTAWLYLGTVGLSLGLILLWLLPNLLRGDTGAWKATFGVGVALIAVGLGSYLATRKHPGLLALCILGLALVVPLLLEKAT